MIENQATQEIIDRFFADIEPLTDGYVGDTFSYLAMETPGGFVVVQGFVHLNTNLLLNLLPRFETKALRAGQFRLSDMGVTHHKFLAQAVEGVLTTPDGELLFPCNSNRQYGAMYNPVHKAGSQTQSRIATLQIFGRESPNLDRATLDWMLRAAEKPFDGLQDLINEYRLGQLGNVNSIEFVAFNVAAVDATSTVMGETATLRVRTSLGLQPEKFAVGYRVNEKGKTVARESILGEEFTWTEHSDHRAGVKTFPVPRAAVVQAFPRYNGIAQQYYWFVDPSTAQNSRRAAFEVLDPKLELVNDILQKTTGKNPDSKSFEAAMAWLFWLLGFSPAHFGGVPRTQDGVDVIMCTPLGHFALLECTVGMLKSNHKLQTLHARAVALRRNLEASSIRHLRVLPIVLTSMTLAEVQADVPTAEELGVYVIAREQIEAFIQRTLMLTNADQLYDEAEKSVRDAMERHTAQSTLNLS